MESSKLHFNLTAHNISTTICTSSLGCAADSPLLYTREASIAQVTSLVLVVLCGLSGNGYVGYIIYRSSRTLQNPTFVFILNLVAANIGALALCTPLPLVVSAQRRFELGDVWCKASGFMNNLFFSASIFTLSLIAAHKYFSVVRPMSRSWLQFTEKKAKLCSIGLWLVCAAMSFVTLGPFSNWEYIAFNPTTAHCGIAFPNSLAQRLRLAGLAAVAFLIPLALMCYAYTRIYSKVHAHERRLSTTRTVQQTNPVKRKIAITLCLMFGTFVACWTPFFVLIALAVAMDRASSLPSSLGRIAYWCGYLNCCINPALYCLRTSTFKEIRLKSSSQATTQRIDTGTKTRTRAVSLPNLIPKNRRLSSIIPAYRIEVTPAASSLGWYLPSSYRSPPQSRGSTRIRAYSISSVSTANFDVAATSRDRTLRRYQERKASRTDQFSVILESTAESAGVNGTVTPDKDTEPPHHRLLSPIHTHDFSADLRRNSFSSTIQTSNAKESEF